MSDDQTNAVVDEESEDGDSAALGDDQIYDYISNEPVKSSPAEQTLQAVARALVDEYGFEHTQLARELSFSVEVFDEYGRARKARRKASIAVFSEDIRKDDPQQITPICIIQPHNTKAGDRKRCVALLEETMGALEHCDFGLWSNGTDLVFRQKLTGGGRIQPDYVDLYDLPGYGETTVY